MFEFHTIDYNQITYNSINMFKHIKLLQCGSDRYHGLHRRVVAKSCQCRTICEVDKVLKKI